MRKRLTKWSVFTKQENAKTPRSNSGPDKDDNRRVSTTARARRNIKHDFRILDSAVVKARVTDATAYSAAMVATSFRRHDIVA
jgi:hypothetical protein